MKLAVLALLFTTASAWAQTAGLTETSGSRTVNRVLVHATTDERIRAYEKLLAAARNDPQENALALQAGLISAYLQKLRESADYTYLDRASKLVDTMLQNDGGNFAALRFQNEIDLQRHEFRAVAERAQDMAKYAPSDPGNWGNLGDALMELGEYEQAGNAYSKMFALRPNLASYNRLAYFHFVTGDAQVAIGFMRAAVDAGGSEAENTAWCWAELGDIYFKTGKLDDAGEAYREAIALFPTLHRASAGLGKVEAARGHLETAIQYYRRAQSIVPLVEYTGALEDLYAASGFAMKAQEQRELLATIQTIGKATGEKTNRNLALVLADHNRDLPLALNLMQAEIPVRGDVYTWDAFAWVLFKSGRVEEAKAASLKAVKRGTPEPLFYYHASKIADASGDQVAAREYSNKLNLLNPRFDFAKCEMASVAKSRMEKQR